jgi:hypothetical protein
MVLSSLVTRGVASSQRLPLHASVTNTLGRKCISTSRARQPGEERLKDAALAHEPRGRPS